jgi:hypothetical protein
MITMKQSLQICILGILLTLMGSGPAFARGFSDATLLGSYIVRFAGHSSNGDADGIGILSFDGEGNFSGTDGPNCQLSGSYTIGRTGSMAIGTDPNTFFTPGCFYHIASFWNLVLADRTGSRVYASGYREDTDTESATLTRRWVIQRHTFTAADLSGYYGFLIRSRLPFPVASNGPDATGAGEVSGVGLLHSDGAGNVSVNIISLQTYKPGPQFATCSGTTDGTYTVNPDGTGSLSLPKNI